MAKVYVTNNPGDIDLSKAAKFGDLVYLTEGKLNIYRPADVLSKVDDGLFQFDPAVDYLLMAGGMLSMFCAGVVLGGAAKLQLLMYDAKEKDYFVRTVDMEAQVDG